MLNIPNLITIANLSCGLMGLEAVMLRYYNMAAYFVLAALVFDVLDGFLARILKQSSEIGKQLDSLSDMVSFGVLPGFLMFHLATDRLIAYSYVPYLACLIPLFAALRLSKFNVDTRQMSIFMGLPTPAGALFFVGYTFLEHNSLLYNVFFNEAVMAVSIVLVSVLFVLDMPLLSFKFSSQFSFQRHLPQLLIILVSIVSFGVLWVEAPIFIVFVYILISVVTFQLNPNYKP